MLLENSLRCCSNNGLSFGQSNHCRTVLLCMGSLLPNTTVDFLQDQRQRTKWNSHLYNSPCLQCKGLQNYDSFNFFHFYLVIMQIRRLILHIQRALLNFCVCLTSVTNINEEIIANNPRSTSRENSGEAVEPFQLVQN